MKKFSFKALCYRYRHVLIFLYLPIYLVWFIALEHDVTDYHLTHAALDDLIPFCEIFVIPYISWFVYIAAIGTWMFFRDRQDFCRFCVFLFTGMTLALLICTIWPNGQALRPDLDTLGRDNVFIDIIRKYIYGQDTPTNVFPSIHVINTVGACCGIVHTKRISKKNMWIRIAVLIQGVLIILSTVFMKQHSVVDVAGALLVSIPLYFLAYRAPFMNRIKAEIDEPIFVEK